MGIGDGTGVSVSPGFHTILALPVLCQIPFSSMKRAGIPWLLLFWECFFKVVMQWVL